MTSIGIFKNLIGGQYAGFWDFLCGKVTEIKLHAELVVIPKEIKGKSTVKGSKSDNSKRAAQLVLAKDKLTLATNDGKDKEAADIVLKKDGSTTIENKLKESKID